MKISDAYAEFAQVRCERSQRAGRLDREHERRLWGAAQAALGAYANRSNWTTAGSPREPFPAEIAAWLAEFAEQLLTGEMPDSAKALARRGNSAPTPRIRRDIEAALLYVNAARARLIDDRSPVQTILDRYGISDRTWKDWRKKYRDSAATDPNSFYPTTLSTEAREILTRARTTSDDEVSDQDRSRMITSLMGTSARSYRAFRRHNKETED